MKMKQAAEAIAFAIKNRMPLLLTGAPGIGKTDIVKQAAATEGVDLIVSHPVVDDPTDYKGMPFVEDKENAHFIPFGDLKKIMNAKKPTVYFFDDLGQAAASVQAACMQLLLAREINGKKVSDHVTFIAATNRKQDMAGVSGILEPVKSRFTSIIEIEVTTDDWVDWGLKDGNMPVEVLAFIRFRPELLNDFKPSREVTNSPSPRTVANVGKMLNAGLPESLHFEMFKGAAGEGFAAEFVAFLRVYKTMPDIDRILMTGEGDAPNEPAAIYATAMALASRVGEGTLANAIAYSDKLPTEVAFAFMKDAITKNSKLTATKAFIAWATKNGNLIF